MKKILALVLALCMILTIGAAFAAVNNPVFDETVQITNLDPGDKVTLYQVLEWDGYWKTTADYANALTQAEVDDLVGQNHETGAVTTAAGLTSAYIAKIIAVKTAPAVDSATEVGDNGTYTYTSTKAGMYYAVVTPKDGTKIYKPIFVSSDYKGDNTSSTLAVGTAKYETVTIDKKATDQTNNQDEDATYTNGANSYNTVGIGDIVTFEIDTTIPVFPTSFTSPVFKVSDTLNGLTLKHGDGEIKVYAGEIADTNLLHAGTEYTLDANDASFTVSFKADYIKNLTEAQPIKVVYKGEVNTEATYNVNAKENTATVNFSNNPDDTVGANKLKDETRHYTFSINGLVYGERHGTDLIKIGVDKDGNEILATVELPNANWAGALEGAKFTLLAADKTTVVRENLSSGSNGAIEINGLDAGTYWLREDSAPAGFVKTSELTKVEIIPTFRTKTVQANTETINGITVTVPAYDYAELASYEIRIAGEMTSTYTVTNDEISANDDDQIAAGSSEGNPAGGMLGKVPNTEGVELPSTGGIGTTIFYILGGVLVVGAAIILIARRKAHD